MSYRNDHPKRVGKLFEVSGFVLMPKNGHYFRQLFHEIRSSVENAKIHILFMISNESSYRSDVPTFVPSLLFIRGLEEKHFYSRNSGVFLAI